VDTGPLQARVDLPVDRDAPRQARMTVGDMLDSWHVGDLDWVYDVLLVTSELVTDAVKHGGKRVQLEMTLDPSHLMLSVADGSSGASQMRAAPDTAEAARGLAIVQAVADRWGVETTSDGGKLTWVRIADPPL
jgi:anti-sigma regulatory factor (Ser/Thr protein kinase)